MSTKITDHYFEYGALKYFRGNAHLVEIGTFGQKKDPIGAGVYIDPQSKVQRANLVKRVTKGITVGIDWGQTSQAAVEVNGTVKVFKVGVTAAGSLAYSKVKSANVKLYNLFITEGPLKTMLNADATAARNYLATEGADGRIVTEVWIVMEAALAEHFDTSGSISATATTADLKVTASGGKSGTQTITLSAGSVFAYKMHMVNAWNATKTKVEGLESDYYGMG
jgi:hypothetical protein